MTTKQKNKASKSTIHKITTISYFQPIIY